MFYNIFCGPRSLKLKARQREGRAVGAVVVRRRANTANVCCVVERAVASYTFFTLFARACVRACARACVCVRACVCMRASACACVCMCLCAVCGGFIFRFV